MDFLGHRLQLKHEQDRHTDTQTHIHVHIHIHIHTDATERITTAAFAGDNVFTTYCRLHL